MKLQDGELLTLQGTRYRIQKRLGRGAVSDVYLALLDDRPDWNVALKLVRDDSADDSLKIAALQREAEVLNVLNSAEDETWARISDPVARFHRALETTQQRRIIALLDAGEIAFDEPFVVQEVAPAVFERFDITTPTDEYHALAVAQAVAEALLLAHRRNLSFKDFAPDTKGDRLRLQWLDEQQQTFALKIIDWNITGGPEAMVQDLFFFGGHLYHLLTGKHVQLDKEEQPPVNLGMGNPAWERLTTGSRTLIAKALHRDPKKRYAQAEALLADVTWWRDTLAQIESSSVFGRLDDRLWKARSDGRYDRVLAVADLALHLNPSTDMQRSFEQSLKKAQVELDREIRLPIAEAQVALGTRAYEKAALEFARQLKTLPPESEAARLAQIYQQLAGVGDLLLRHYQGADERRSPEWESLETRVIPALVARRWQAAEAALAEVTRLRPESRSWVPLNNLADWAKAGARYVTEANNTFVAAENRADPSSDDWLSAETSCIAAHREALTILETIQKEAPFELEFQERLNRERLNLEKRVRFLGLYDKGKALLPGGQETLELAHSTDNSGDYEKAAELYQTAHQQLDVALEKFQAILIEDANQTRAKLFVRRTQRLSETAKSRWQQATVLQRARQLLLSGNYPEALEQTRAMIQEASEREDVSYLHAEAENGTRLLRQVHGYLQGAEAYLNTASFTKALEQLNSFNTWDGCPLRDLPGGVLPEMVGVRPFKLLEALRVRAGDLRQQILVMQETVAAGKQARDKNNYLEIVNLYKAFRERYPLTDAMQSELDQALCFLANLDLAASSIGETRDFEDLLKVLELLRDDLGSDAEKLRRRAAEKWQLLAQPLALTDLPQLLQRSQEGQRLFSAQAEAIFAGMAAQAERAIAVEERLRVTEGKRPDWFASGNWDTSLSRADENLGALAGAQSSWTELRQQVDEWRATLQNYCNTFAQERLEESREQAQNRRFPEALDKIQDLWDKLPSNLHTNLPRDLREDLSTLHQALAQRLDAEKVFSNVFTRLTIAGAEKSEEESEIEETVTYTFQEAARDLALVELPAHDAVSADDLIAQQVEVKTVAAAELALGITPVFDLKPAEGKRNYAQVIYDCRRAREMRLNALAGYSFVVSRVAALQKQLHGKVSATGRELLVALETAVSEQQQRSEADPRQVIALYAQARWWEAISPDEIHDAMNKARALPRYILKKAAEELAALRDLEGSPEKGPALLLQRAETLNNELVYLPLEKLPPLPENVHPPEIAVTWQLPSGSLLETLRTEIATLRSLLQTAAQVQAQSLPVIDPHGETETIAPAVPNGTMLHYDVAQVAVVQKLTSDLGQSVQRLGALWPSLQLTWNTTCDLARLRTEAEQHAGIAGHLASAHTELAANQAMQGLKTLYQQLEKPEVIKELDEQLLPWLAQPRQALKVNLMALRQELIGALGRQIADILALSNAAEQLREQILLPAGEALWLAEAAYQAVYQGVDVRAKQAEAEGRKDVAQRLWKTVMDATAPWAPQGVAQSSVKKQRKSKARVEKSAPKTKPGAAEKPQAVSASRPSALKIKSPSTTSQPPSSSHPKPRLRD